MWTELFFDLVFVVAVGRTTDLLHEDPSPIGTLWFGFIFVVLVWTWSNFVLYTERFETDDVVHRLSKAVAMFAVAAGALFVPTVREGRVGANEFVVAYVAAQPDGALVLVHVVAIGVTLLVATFGSSWSAAVVVTTLAATLAGVLVCKQVLHAKRDAGHGEGPDERSTSSTEATRFVR